MRHRQAVAIPFVVFALVMVLGGLLNTVSVRATVIDSSSGQPVPNVGVAAGSRSVTSGADGTVALDNVPRNGRVTAQAAGYAPAVVDPAATEIRMQPATLTLQVDEDDTEPRKGIPNPKVRLGDAQVGNGGPTGSVVVVPYPGAGTQLLVCADGYTSRRITASGVFQQLTLAKGGSGCPPLPTAPPAPGASSSPVAPAGSPAPTPSP